MMGSFGFDLNGFSKLVGKVQGGELVSAGMVAQLMFSKKSAKAMGGQVSKKQQVTNALMQLAGVQDEDEELLDQGTASWPTFLKAVQMLQLAYMATGRDDATQLLVLNTKCQEWGPGGSDERGFTTCSIEAYHTAVLQKTVFSGMEISEVLQDQMLFHSKLVPRIAASPRSTGSNHSPSNATDSTDSFVDARPTGKLLKKKDITEKQVKGAKVDGTWICRAHSFNKCKKEGCKELHTHCLLCRSDSCPGVGKCKQCPKWSELAVNDLVALKFKVA